MPRLKNIDTFSQVKDHFHDDYKNLGYHYEGNIMRNVLSPDIFGNPMNDIPLRQFERIIEELINAVRKIKLHYAIVYDKNSRLIN